MKGGSEGKGMCAAIPGYAYADKSAVYAIAIIAK